MRLPNPKTVATIAGVTLAGVALAQRIPATRGVLVPEDTLGDSIAGFFRQLPIVGTLFG